MTAHNPPARRPRTRSSLPLLAISLLTGIALYLYAERWLRALLLYLSAAPWARQLVTGFPPAWYVAGRFVSGESCRDAITATRTLNARGMQVTLDFLGESVSDPAEARAARDEILSLLDHIDEAGVAASVSVKLTQLGLKVDPDLAYDNMRQILERAARYGNFVRIDMEESAVVDLTLDIYRRLRAEGFDNTGVVIQSYLYRSEADVRRLIAEGASVRLCKGAYMEPPDVAFPDKKDVDDNYVRLTELLLTALVEHPDRFIAIATHDEKMIDATIDIGRRLGLSPGAYELQMLYGIRRELQEALVARGYRMRVYVPYGTAWYPYFMRRLAERPANLWFFVSNFFRR
jgi:proline dehydrogenase